MKYEEFKARTAFSKEELLAMACGNCVEDFDAELGLLPAPPMLMLDRVTSVSHAGPRGRIVAEKDISVDDWFFLCHFRGDPVQPGCLGVDAVWQLLGLYCGLRGAVGTGRALGCREVDFFGQIRPHDRVVRYDVDVRRYSAIKSTGTGLVIGSAKVFVDDQHIYSITDARVGTFLGIRYGDYPHPSPNSRGGVVMPKPE